MNRQTVTSTSSRIDSTMDVSGWAMLLTLSILWGGSFFFVKVAVAELTPFTIVTLRVGLAALILFIILRISGISLSFNWRVWLAFLGMGFLNNVVPFSLIVWGQTHIASGLAAVLNATTPLATVIIAHFFTADEKITINRFAGVIVGFFGVVVMIGPAVFKGFGLNITAQLACLAAAFSYALAGVFG